MRRDMVWVEKERFRGWACSECAWAFNPSGVPTGNTIAEMKQNYERQRDVEFGSHVCAQHPRPQAEHVSSSMVDSSSSNKPAPAPHGTPADRPAKTGKAFPHRA